MSAQHHGQTAVIAGAGPAGLTAALELLRRSAVTPVVVELDAQVGGIAKTVEYRGNRMDLGGHRFFSKSDWVMRWWQEILPVASGQGGGEDALRINYQSQSHDFRPAANANANANSNAAGDSDSDSDKVMLVRQRLSRIFYRRRFFDYPLKLNANTVRNMGLAETLLVAMSYGRAQILRRSPQISLEDFFVNRFGTRLYRTFFKDYTEKVWGVSCREISAEWGAQRIKGLSVAKAVAHAIGRPFRNLADTSQKRTETSLIERFLYPKFGPGQMWEEVARQVSARGGSVHLRHRVVGLERRGTDIVGVDVLDERAGSVRRLRCDHFISTLPVRDLVAMLEPEDPAVRRVADHLPYRDFMTAGLLLRKMHATGGRADPRAANGMPPDNWIYIQEPDVKIGRLQVFNNWSPAMVADPATIWLGLEYFCRQGDALWSLDDGAFIDLAARELEKIGLIDRRDVLDGTVVRVPKAYPAYFGEYRDFATVRAYLDGFANLYPVGRNGMHRYNNQDHSMLAANAAVDSIVGGSVDKSAIWLINAEEDYHEEAGKLA
ncbi:MAG TPA: NAD(P)/FAD-dependent oxidoreductase [Steroidobacteraceae bacterium]|nr:NAD(P)/FAD-dependent oxidoreductase [Steroidobacteraceae bacterium]